MKSYIFQATFKVQNVISNGTSFLAVLTIGSRGNIVSLENESM